MWTKELARFEDTARESFDFLHDEMGYSEPVIELARDLFVIYAHPTGGRVVRIGWERDWFVPFISVERTQGGEDRLLGRVLDELGIEIDTTSFPHCAELARNELPSLGDTFFHWWNRRRLREEYPTFVREHAKALRAHHDRVFDQLG